MTVIPTPPDLKPTIIQMQNSDSTTTSPNIQPNTTEDKDDQPKKRRRRSSSSLVSQSEIEKRRKEHKTAHSIIEKKRRIRMNREFEALKFLIPACRNSLVGGQSSNSGEGMYKLTILQATVDYIKYLHNVINIQQSDLSDLRGEGEPDELEFAKIEIDTEGYRNVDNDFSFNKLLEDYFNKSSVSSDSSKKRSPSRTDSSFIQPDTLAFQTLPSPIITPELYPSSSSSSSTSFSSAIKSDFQFRKPKSNSLSMANSLSSELQLPPPQRTRKSVSQVLRSPASTEIDQVNKSSEAKPNNSQVEPRGILAAGFKDLAGPESLLESDSANVLLSMKNDGSISSIRSLLN